MSKPIKNVQWWIVPLFILVGIVIYSNTLKVPFYFDDDRNIKNPTLQMDEFSVASVLQAGFEGTLKKRPISNISFAINRLIDGFNTTGYHVVNITVHICTAIFLFFLFHTTLSLPVNQTRFSRFPALAWITAFIWLVHPLATQSVTYIVQRMTSLASMFYILSMLLYVLGRVKHEDKTKNNIKIFFFAGSFISGLLAIGSKEIALTLPFFIALYEWYFFQDLDRQWLRHKIPWIIGLIVVGIAIVFFYTDGRPYYFLINSCSGREFTLQERLLTQPRVIVHYMSLLLFPDPSRLSLDYNFPLSHSLLQPISTVVSMAVLGAVLVASLVLARGERLLSFCLLWFLGNLIIESSVICLEIIFEHRTYLPSMFFLLMVTLFFYTLCRKNRVMIISSILLAALLGVWTYQRNLVWANPVMFWEDSVLKDPASPRVHTNLGNAYFIAGDIVKAKQHYARALQLEPEFRWAQDNIGFALDRLGDLAGAEAAYREMIRLEPHFARAHSRLAHVLERQGQLVASLNEYEKALQYAPDNSRYQRDLGRVLMDLGRLGEAIEHFSSVQAKQSNDGVTLTYLGEALARQGKDSDAMQKFKQAIASDPDLVAAHFNLAQVLLKQNKNQEALTHFLEVEKRDPETVPALFNIAIILSGEGRHEESVQYFRKLIKIVPPDADLHNNLGVQFLKLDRPQEAKEEFLKALEIDAGHSHAGQNLKITVKRQGALKVQ